MRSKSARHSIDIHVGNRVRMRRMMLKISQTKLAETLGMTFQQVQKYEKGTNRISASVLYFPLPSIAKSLNLGIRAFPKRHVIDFLRIEGRVEIN